MTLASTAQSITSPVLEIPLPYMISNSACLKGGATLFLTILTFVLFPNTVSPDLMLSIRLTSRRMDEKNFNARPPVVVSLLPYMTPIFSRS